MSDLPSDSPLISQFADDADMLELIQMFAAELPERAAALRDALSAGELHDLGKIAHQLKGAGGGYGYPSITEVALKLETLTRDDPDQLDAVRQGVDELVDLCRRAALGAAAPS